MFATHAAAIREWAAFDPERWYACAAFVQCTIQQPLWRAVGDTQKVLRARTLRARNLDSILWGFKRSALEDARYSMPALCTLAANGADRDTLLEHAARIHGFGLPKAGFLLQLTTGESACLDTHNLTRFNINPNAFRFGERARGRTLQAKVALYHATIDTLGGSAGLWDSWCEYVAPRDKRYRDAFHVSALHCEALGITCNAATLAA
jgi:hypothetical protein